MGLNLYYGGLGTHQTFSVAENIEDAKKKIGIKLGLSFLTMEAEKVDDIDGYSIVPTTVFLEDMTDTYDLYSDTMRNAPDPPKLRHCKKCDFTCENQGELLAHYREAHPKEG